MDYDFTTFPVSYSLSRDGALVQSATMSGNQPISRRWSTGSTSSR